MKKQFLFLIFISISVSAYAETVERVVLSINDVPHIDERTATAVKSDRRKAERSSVKSEGELFVTTDDFAVDGYILELFSDGSIVPKASLKNRAGLLPGQQYPRSIVLDTSSREVFVADSVANSITVYRKDEFGEYAPTRKIKGPSSALATPTGIAIDPATGLLFVSNTGRGYPYSDVGTITIYNTSDNGDVVPLKIIQDVDIRNPVGVAIDSQSHELFIADRYYNSIVVFAVDANLNPKRVRTIQGSLTGLDQPTSIAIDSKYHEIIIANSYNYADPSLHRTNSVTIYNTSMNGNVRPKRYLSGAATKLRGPVGIAIDQKNDRLYVVNRITKQKSVFSQSAAEKRVKSLKADTEELVDIVIFQHTDAGNHSPLRTILLTEQDSAHSIFYLP